MPQRRRSRRWVYPRTRGGTLCQVCGRSFDQGLSPHTRGNRDRQGSVQLLPGSIPAHAGEPGSGSDSVSGSGVYPRTRGGTSAAPLICPQRQGLSPHTRGNRKTSTQEAEMRGSIPAHAGEPARTLTTAGQCKVYPRTRGGTETSRTAYNDFQGLSPHTRGNPVGFRPRFLKLGSIPAHAGEPRY